MLEYADIRLISRHYLKRKIVRAALVIKNDLDCKEDYTMNHSTEVKQKLLSIITEMDSYRWLFYKESGNGFFT